jgi:predicted nucleotidyltransferase
MNNAEEKPRYVREEEVKAVEKVIAPILEENKVVSICLYGSRVAGYAKPDSDYDVLIVLEDYKPTVRYRYLQGEVPVSGSTCGCGGS